MKSNRFVEKEAEDRARKIEHNRRAAAFTEVYQLCTAFHDGIPDMILNLSQQIGMEKLAMFKLELLGGAQDALKRCFMLPNFDQIPTDSFDAVLATWKETFTRPRSEIIDVLFDAFARLFRALPPYVGEPMAFETPFVRAIHDPSPIDAFFHAFQREDKLFWSIYSDYTQAWYKAQAAVEADFVEKYSEKYFDMAIPLAPFYALRDPQVKLHITIPQKHRFEGIWIIAPPGRGKTTLLSQLLQADLKQVLAGTASVILMDSKGDLIDHARRLERFAPGGDLEGKLVLIEPTNDLALNPLDIGASTGHTIALLEYIFSSLLDTAPTPLQSTLFRSVLMAMKVIPEATFSTFRRFLTEGWKPFEEYIKTMHPDDASFFTNGEYDSKTYSETKQQLLWRIRDLTTKVPLLRDMFKAPKTLIDIGKEMDAGKVIIIDNSAAKLSAGSEFFSRFFVALILGAAQQRAGREEENKMPCYFYIDECDTVVARDPNIATILDRCRSQKIGLVLAHQRLKQIDNEKVLDALSNSAVRIANSDDDAPALAGRMRTTPELLRSLKKGKFAVFMRDLMKQPIVVSVPNEPISGWAKMTDGQFADIQREMKERYCFTGQPELPEPVDQEPDTGPAKWG